MESGLFCTWTKPFLNTGGKTPGRFLFSLAELAATLPAQLRLLWLQKVCKIPHLCLLSCQTLFGSLHVLMVSQNLHINGMWFAAFSKRVNLLVSYYLLNILVSVLLNFHCIKKYRSGIQSCNAFGFRQSKRILNVDMMAHWCYMLAPPAAFVHCVTELAAL